MTTLTNPEGNILNYTNGFIETVLLQLNSSINYYTTGNDDTLFIKIGSNIVLILYNTLHINRNIVENFTINGNTTDDYNLEFTLDNTSNEYTLQGVYNASPYPGTITSLQQVFLAIHDTDSIPFPYTWSENMNLINNEISLAFLSKTNHEVV